ncbi:MAG: serine hydrolase, partial [Bacteroidota bacterium]
ARHALEVPSEDVALVDVARPTLIIGRKKRPEAFLAEFEWYSPFKYVTGQRSLNWKDLKNQFQQVIWLDTLPFSEKVSPQRQKVIWDSLGQFARQFHVGLTGSGNPSPPVEGGQLMARYPGSESERLAVQVLCSGPNLEYPKRILRAAVDTAEVNMAMLARIDDIAYNAIRNRAMPGCQVMVIHKGQVIFEKAYGYHTYRKRRRVQLSDVYDIASITKVAGTTLATMLMYEFGDLDLSASLKQYYGNTKITLRKDTSSTMILHDNPELVDTLHLDVPNLDELDLSVELIDEGIVDELPFKSSTLAPESTQVSLPVMPTLPDSILSNIQKKSAELTGQGSASRPNKSVSEKKVPKVRSSIAVLSRTSNIFTLTPAELLTHHSGLQPGLPLRGLLTPVDTLPLSDTTRYWGAPHPDFPIEVAQNIFLRQTLQDSVWQLMKHLLLFKNKPYQYSDINMVLLQRTIDTINQASIATYLEEKLYGPLGLQHLCYLPRETLPVKRIVPTELDLGWRRQLLRGYVHDPTAALMGGIAGNAGIFSNVRDLAILGQLLLNKGTYGQKRFFSPETVVKFTKRRKGHRAYGFDMPPERGTYLISQYASDQTFGHTGFTGTCLWIDPVNDLIFVFLSNRVHPSSRNWRLNRLRVRQRMHDAAYRAIGF